MYLPRKIKLPRRAWITTYSIIGIELTYWCTVAGLRGMTAPVVINLWYWMIWLFVMVFRHIDQTHD